MQVLTDGLRVNDVANSTYVLWQFSDDGVARGLGNFDVPSAQVGLARVGELPPEGGVVSRFAVSLERGRRATEPGRVRAGRRRPLTRNRFPSCVGDRVRCRAFPGD